MKDTRNIKEEARNFVKELQRFGLKAVLNNSVAQNGYLIYLPEPDQLLGVFIDENVLGWTYVYYPEDWLTSYDVNSQRFLSAWLVFSNYVEELERILKGKKLRLKSKMEPFDTDYDRIIDNYNDEMLASRIFEPDIYKRMLNSFNSQNRMQRILSGSMMKLTKIFFNKLKNNGYDPIYVSFSPQDSVQITINTKSVGQLWLWMSEGKIRFNLDVTNKWEKINICYLLQKTIAELNQIQIDNFSLIWTFVRLLSIDNT